MSALRLISSFSNQISDNRACYIIHPHFQADHYVPRKQFKTWCDLEKISGSPDSRNLVCARVIYSLNSGRWTTDCFRYTGKLNAIWLTFISLRPV